MKKVALVFVLAVLAPSLVLAWLAVRSLHDQQFVLERQQSLLDQRTTDTLAQNVAAYLAQQQQDFSAQVESLAAGSDARKLAGQFDDQLRKQWPLAEVGFCVTSAGKILSPQPNARPAAQMFRLDNSGFLGNREPVEVYLSANNLNSAPPGANVAPGSSWNFGRGQAGQSQAPVNSSFRNSNVQASQPSPQENGKLGGAVTDVGAENNTSGNNAAPSTVNNGLNSSRNANTMAFALKNSIGNLNSQVSPTEQPGSKQLDEANAASPATLSMAQNSTAPGAVDAATGVAAPAAAAAPESRSFGRAESDQVASQQKTALDDNAAAKDVSAQQQVQTTFNYKAAESRKVSPQSQVYQALDKAEVANLADNAQNNLSKVVPAEAEFRQLIGDQSDGMFARFLQNKLKLMCWHRLSTEPDLIFGAQLDLDRVVDGLRNLVQSDGSWGDEICLAILDDNAKPVVLSRNNFQASWKQPFVATEIGDALPHWEAAGYLVHPERLKQSAHTAKLALGLLITVLVVAIGIGSVLIVRSLNVELKLARQKTDFVGNVSHELKTPLTSIRMFSELLADGRVADPAKQHSYLQIITAEAARLTRLINNVLDFSRMERGEKKYTFQPCDLTEIVRSAAETFRPHLESAGFRFNCELAPAPISIRGDTDALSQVIVNLLSNAEKYSNGGKEITVQLTQKQAPLPHAEIKILDRGPGVPRGSEEKVFEKFYRAHDSLSSGIQGSGLGLTIARQIARAHGGDVVYETRDGGGSCFSLRLPVQTS